MNVVEFLLCSTNAVEFLLCSTIYECRCISFCYAVHYMNAYGFNFAGKRRTNRNSKDENAVVGHLDGPKGPKDSRLETRLVNGSLVGSKMSSAGAARNGNKITSYFSPSR